MPYNVELCYGYFEGECGIYHAFRLVAPEKDFPDDVEKSLTESLETKADNPNFKWDCMHLNLPDAIVERIKAAVRADLVGYVRHLFSVLRASVGPLLRGFRVSKLNVIWTITGETAAETAILYGQTLTTLNTILAIAQDHIKIQADQLWLEADYTGSAKQQRVVSLKLLLCPLLALVTVVCFVWHARHDPQLLPPKHPKYNTPETEQGGNL